MECWVEHEYKHHIASVKLGFYNQFASLKLEPDLYISQPISAYHRYIAICMCYLMCAHVRI